MSFSIRPTVSPTKPSAWAVRVNWLLYKAAWVVTCHWFMVDRAEGTGNVLSVPAGSRSRSRRQGLQEDPCLTTELAIAGSPPRRSRHGGP